MTAAGVPQLPPFLSLGVALRQLPGEVEMGDHYLVKPFTGGALVAAVDGLGHGPEASRAARRAVKEVDRYAHESVTQIVNRCHQVLRTTRGVVMTLASLDTRSNQMTWLGVGNVEGVILRADSQARPAREYILLSGGVVGFQVPQLRASAVDLVPGDTLILASDGIHSGFAEGLDPRYAPQELANRILARHARPTDDALVVVVRYLGVKP